MKLDRVLAHLTSISALFAAIPAAGAPFFSIAPIFGTSFPATSNSAVLLPGPIGGPPFVAFPPAFLGVAGAPTDDVNAFTTPSPPGDFFFSVDVATTGAAGAVAVEAGFAQAAGDVYTTTFSGSNTLFINQDVLGLLPPVAAGGAAAPPLDDLDALDFDGGPLLFAMITGHPYAGTFPGCGSDIFAPGPVLAISYITLGLGSCADDIDALQIDSVTGDVYFSLAPGSPSFGILALPGPAAIYISPGGTGPVGVAFAAGLLGLHPTDNLDALAWEEPPPTVPALPPTAIGLLASLFVASGAWTVARARRTRA
jgi:hypothetical protein